MKMSKGSREINAKASKKIVIAVNELEFQLGLNHSLPQHKMAGSMDKDGECAGKVWAEGLLSNWIFCHKCEVVNWSMNKWKDSEQSNDTTIDWMTTICNCKESVLNEVVDEGGSCARHEPDGTKMKCHLNMSREERKLIWQFKEEKEIE